MKIQHTLTSIISSFLLFVFCVSVVHAQNDSINTTLNKQAPIKKKYGLRFGADLSKLLRTNLDKDYNGFEIAADLRIKQKLYLAAEIGYDNKNTSNDYLDITTKGSYFKGGIDINLYENWLDMDNMIYSGFRIGASTFSHDLNSYSIYHTNHYWSPHLSSNQTQEFTDLTAFWAELIFGFKVELFNNLYLGLNAQLKYMLNDKTPDNFDNVFVPGFNKTYDTSRIGVGYAYTLSYRIPILKK